MSQLSFLITPAPPRSTLFPYTTLFRSNPSELRLREAQLWSHTDEVAGIDFNTSDQLRLLQDRSEEHTSELQSLRHLVCRLLLEKKNNCAHYGASLARLNAPDPTICDDD